MTTGTVFLIMGLASTAASGSLLRSLKPLWSGAEFGLAYVAKENWDLGSGNSPESEAIGYVKTALI